MLPKLLPRHHGLADTLKYLFAPIGAHTDPHLVAAWDGTLLEFDDSARPGAVERRELVRRLDAPRRLRDKHVKAGHVLHVPIAAHREDGLLGDARWRELAAEFVATLGLDGYRWVAVHHGPSTSGNDHIHLVVQLVGEDGRVARLDHSKRKARAWALQVEQRLDLVRTGPAGTGARELSRAEHERAVRSGVEPQRRTLERRVRTAAAGSSRPGEFVDNLGRDGVRVDPVLDPDGAERIVGYTVALAQDQVLDGGPALRLAGGQLARDLSLPELLDRWRADRPPIEPVDDPQDPGQVEDRQALRDELLVTAFTRADAWRPEDRDRPLRWSGRVTAERQLRQALELLDTLDSTDSARRHLVVEQTASFAAVVAVLLPSGVGDPRGPVAQDVRVAAGHLAAAARLTHPFPTRRPARRGEPVLPSLAAVARLVLRADGDPELVLMLVLVAALAVLVMAVARWFDARSRRGEAGAHVHAAATLLGPYRPTAVSPTVPRGSTEEATRRRLLASQSRLVRRLGTGLGTPDRHGGRTQ